MQKNFPYIMVLQGTEKLYNCGERSAYNYYGFNKQYPNLSFAVLVFLQRPGE